MIKLMDIIDELRREYEPDYVCEGLIRSYPIKQAVSILERTFFNDAYHMTFKEKDGRIMCSFHHTNPKVNKSLTSDDFDYILKNIDVLGYTPSYYMEKNFMKGYHKFDKKTILDILNSELYVLVISPKFELPLNVNDIPDILYHITPSKFEESILKNGLIPKSKSNFENYKDRVYFAIDLDGIEMLIKNVKFKSKDITEYVLFKFDSKSFKEDTNNSNRFLYRDQSFKNKAIYTMDNISPKYLSVIKRFTS